MDFLHPHSKEGVSMRPAALSVALLVVLTTATARSAEMSIGANFTVLAPNQGLADAVAKQAEVYRKQAALEWLGKELPDRVGRSLITVDITSQKDEGLTWPIDCPERTLHQVWLTTSVDRALGTTLHHEVIHTVLDSHFYPESLPAWASEGIASQADDAGRKENQRQILARWSKAGRWPVLRVAFRGCADRSRQSQPLRGRILGNRVPRPARRKDAGRRVCQQRPETRLGPGRQRLLRRARRRRVANGLAGVGEQEVRQLNDVDRFPPRAPLLQRSPPAAGERIVLPGTAVLARRPAQ